MNLAVLPGTTGAIRLVDLGDPGLPDAGMVRVRMLRMPINPADLLAIDGRYAFTINPAEPLGAEGVGRIEAVGAAVDDARPGDLVLPLTRGNWCTVRLVARSAVVVLPSGIDPAVAAMLRINPVTAWLMLQSLGLGQGDVVVQNGAGSMVAAWLRAFARNQAIDVVDVVRQPDPTLPDAIIDGPDLAGRVRAARGAAPIGALDCVAGEASGRMAACLAPGGQMLVFGHLSGEPVTIASQLLTGGGLTVRGFSLRPAEAALGAAGVQRLFAAIIAALPDRPPLPVRAVLPLAEAEHGIALARQARRGRVQLTG